MDSFREYSTEFDLPQAEEAAQSYNVAAIGADERRMHVRAYNHWVSLLHGRDFPSIEDLEPEELEDFAANSVLLDFTCGHDNPAIPYVGNSIREECGLHDDVRTIADVPSRSLLSRLTDHYLQIIANRSPVGFEAEFENLVGKPICYRGILMPLSSDGDSIDFIYGVINWKHVDGPAEATASENAQGGFSGMGVIAINEPLELSETIQETIEPEVGETPSAEADEERAAQFADSPVAVFDEESAAPPRVPFSWEVDEIEDEDAIPAIALDADAGLADRLWAARETAETVKAGEGRTRAALYSALSLAYDFAVATECRPDEYAALLEESGVKAQARAPMTPVVKLIFGIDYDKARLTEFAAALAYAHRQEIPAGGFQDFIEKQAGGLKAMVAAERGARRPETKADSKGEVARARLRTVPALSLADVPAGDEFALVLTRRSADGRHEPVAVVDDEALVERAIRRTA